MRDFAANMQKRIARARAGRVADQMTSAEAAGGFAHRRAGRCGWR